MKDADVRLTEDVQRLAEGFTSFFSRGAYTVTSGIIFACQSVWEFGLSCELSSSGRPFAVAQTTLTQAACLQTRRRRSST